MIALIEKMFGISIPAWIIEAVLIASLATGAYLWIEHRGASEELSKLKTSSAALIVKANADIAKETAAHAADVKANQEKLDAALATATIANNALADSVRGFDAYRRQHPDVPRPAGGPVATSGGECGDTSCGDLASRLAKVGDELAASQGQLVATLQSCERDRDSLTGLPK